MASLRHTPLALVVLKTLLSEKDSAWTVTHVSDATGLSYSSCYQLLNRLVDRRLVYRAYIDSGIGSAKLHYEINPYGLKLTKHMLKVMPNPEAWLDVCVVEDETTPSRLTVVGAVG